MKLEEFEDRLDQHGSDIGTWPQDVASQAKALLTASADARRLLDEAKALDNLFAAGPAIKAPAGLAGRIVARALNETNTPSGAEPAGIVPGGTSLGGSGASARAARIAALATPVPAQAIPPQRRPAPPVQPSPGWYRELVTLVFGSGSLMRPATALAICFAAGLCAGYIFNQQGIDSSSYNVMASLFTYLDRT